MHNVLLLNPPGQSRYIRDYYCSKTSKSAYSYTPVDFLYISAHLDKYTNLSFIDCIIEKTSKESLMRKLIKNPPDIIISLTGFVSWLEDFSLFKDIKDCLPRTSIVGSGDVLLGSNVALLFEKSALDAILYDFSSTEIIEYCLGRRPPFKDIAYNELGKIVEKAKEHGRKKIEEVSIGVPPHSLFPLKKYEYPFVREEPFATVLTDYSCPYRCTFCIMSQLEYKYRKSSEVIEELRVLKNEGIEEIYFADQTFGAHKKNTRRLLEKMIEERLDFGWVCFSRTDVIREDLLILMKKAGCHTIIFGIEFGTDENLHEAKKDLTVSQNNDGIALCRRHRIRTVGTFLMGEGNQTADDLDNLIEYSVSLGLDFASFNVYVPRVDDYFQDKKVLDRREVFDQSGGVTKSCSSTISDRQLAIYHKKAVRKFYLRPSYILRRLIMLKTLVELRILVREGYYLIRSMSA